MERILSGKKASDFYKQQLINEIKKLEDTNKNVPTLAIVIPKADDASLSYLKMREKLAKEIGINLVVHSFKMVDQEELSKLIKELNENKEISGIIIDRPFPKEINEQEIYDLISAKKDVDGCNSVNAGLLMHGQQTHFPSTAVAVRELLMFYEIEIIGKNVIVIGRSKTVGLPAAKLLLDKDATVTIAHSKTKNLKELCQKADIIVVAVGKIKMINEEYVSKNTIIIDVGIHYDEKEDKMFGDVDPKVYEIVKSYSPVPGGVGPLTSVMLMKNVLEAHKGDLDG